MFGIEGGSKLYVFVKEREVRNIFFDAEEDGSQPIRRLSAGDGLAERGLT